FDGIGFPESSSSVTLDAEPGASSTVRATFDPSGEQKENRSGSEDRAAGRSPRQESKEVFGTTYFATRTPRVVSERTALSTKPSRSSSIPETWPAPSVWVRARSRTRRPG